MNRETISLEDDEMDALAQLVAEAILSGDSRDSILADLSNNGIPEDEAEDLVSLVELQLFQVDVADSHPVGGSSDGGGGMGWLIWIVVIVVFKILANFF